MNKILALSLIVVVTISLVTSGTLAFFSDTETTDPNTFSAGTIDITVTEDSNTIISGSVSELKPCMTGYKIIRITSEEGSNPMELWKKVNVLGDGDRNENGVVEPEQDYYTNNSITSPPGKNDIDRYIHFDMWIETNAGSTPADVTYNATAGDIMIIPESEGWLLSDNSETGGFEPAVIAPVHNGVSGNYTYLGQISGGEVMIVVQSFHMDKTVGNWAQSDNITFTEEIVAQQIEGTLPDPPGSVLPGHGRP